MSDSKSDSPIDWEQVVVGIICDNDKVLLGLREMEPARGIWALPGGRLNHGESHHQGLLREIGEELGLFHLDFVHNLPTAVTKAHILHGDRDRPIKAFHYRMTIIAGVPQALDATSEIRWCGEDDCKKLYQEDLLLEASAEAMERTLDWVIRKQ